MAAIFVVAFACVIWLLGGVEPDEIARYLAYEFAYILAPGWLLLRAAIPGVRGALPQIAVGWALGYVLEILAFSFTAAVDARDMFLAYPVAVGVPALLLWRRREAAARPRRRASVAEDQPDQPGGWRWVTAGLCVVALTYVGGVYFTETPLPGSVETVVYHADLTYNLAVTAEAKHHWPIGAPSIVGESLSYHHFVNQHIAAASQVTGIDLPVVFFRLYLVPLTILLVLQFTVLGTALTGIRLAGPIAAGLFLFVDEVDLSALELHPFIGTNNLALWLSPSFTLGLAVFMPTLLLVLSALDQEVRRRWVARPTELPRHIPFWLLLALLLVGCGGGKGPILPLLIGGVLLYLAWRRISQGSFDRVGAAILALATTTLLVFVAILYGTGGQGLQLAANSPVLEMPAVELVDSRLPEGIAVDVVFTVAATAIGTALLLAPALLGLLWLIPQRLSSLRPGQALPLALLAVALVPYFLIRSDGYNQLYFTMYAVAAVLPLSAGGLWKLLSAAIGRGLRPRVVWAFCALWTAGLVVAGIEAARLDDVLRPLRALVVPYLIVAAMAAVAALAVAARRSLRRHWAPLAVAAALLTAGANSFIDWLPERVDRLANGPPVYATAGGLGLGRDTYRGLEWIRDHLDEEAVMLIDRQPSYRPGEANTSNVDYAAFAERRAFLEGWAYGARTWELGPLDEPDRLKARPYSDRIALKLDALSEADPFALETLASQYGVTHIVVERPTGIAHPRLYRTGPTVFSNATVDVIELRR